MTKITVGNDIIEIKRISDLIEKHDKHFLNKVFSDKEQAYCARRANSYAGRYAAKEAIVKALGTGIGKEISWHDMEILNDDRGKPIVFLSDKVNTHFGNPEIEISISHCREYASAVAIIIK
jgi:holo-[acyl-carrier protein] synthase